MERNGGGEQHAPGRQQPRTGLIPLKLPWRDKEGI